MKTLLFPGKNTGYLVLEKNGDYVYGDETPEGEVYATSDLVGKVNPKKKGKKQGLQPKPKKAEDCEKQICGLLPTEGLAGSNHHRSMQTELARLSKRSLATTQGVVKNLVVLLRYKNHKKRELPSVEDIDILMNSETPHPDICPTGSLKGVYKELSYGKLTIESTVTEWYTTSETEAWYAGGRSV